jgi:integrase
VVYRFLLYTGLRRSEADQLRWGYVHLDVANPYVELPAAITKSGRPERVPLVPEVAASLRGLREGAGPSQSVFHEIPSMHLFRKDLEAADIPEADERGRKVVLHSLRHSLATMLAQSKVPPAIAQQIMRHSDIKLTLQWYTDEGLLPTAAAMAALPVLHGT